MHHWFVLAVTPLLVAETMLSTPSSVRLDQESMSPGPSLLISNLLSSMKLGPVAIASSSIPNSSSLARKMLLITSPEAITQVYTTSYAMHSLFMKAFSLLHLWSGEQMNLQDSNFDWYASVWKERSYLFGFLIEFWWLLTWLIML